MVCNRSIGDMQNEDPKGSMASAASLVDSLVKWRLLSMVAWKTRTTEAVRKTLLTALHPLVSQLHDLGTLLTLFRASPSSKKCVQMLW